jgi:hypothetical protein
MKPALDTLTQIDELPGEEIEFGIGDPRWVMRTQAELYSDISTAIIREYSTNAYDAHVMAGHRDPIEVTLPNVMDNFFIVRDHGVGMSLEILKKIYTQFGISDKRGDNNVNGMLGYGSKSGVAYTNTFTVETVRDGHKVSGVIMRKPDWRIVLKVVNHSKTDESNGTTIKIPVHNIDEFNHKAREFFKFWLPGRVLINGVAPVHHVGNEITKNLYYSKDWNTSYVVMGNVAYRINNPAALFSQVSMQAMNFVAYVDDFKTADGTAPVDFTPSREDLKYTERTKETLHAIIKDFETQILESARKDIASAPNHAEAYKRWAGWGVLVGKQLFTTLEYKGEKFENQFAIKGQKYNPAAYRNSVGNCSAHLVSDMPYTVVVTEYDNNNIGSDQKHKAREYAAKQGWNARSIIFTASKADEITSVWVSKEQFVTWDTIKASIPKKPRNPYASSYNAGRIKGSWDIITRDGEQAEQTLDPKNTHYWISVQRNKSVAVHQILRTLKSDAVVVIVPANRLEKFKRDNPKIENFADWAIAKVVRDGASLLSEEAKTVFAQPRGGNWLPSLDATVLNDPEIARLQDLFARRDELVKDYQDNLTLAQVVGIYVTPFSGTANTYLNDNYPLITSAPVSTATLDHVHMYINAVYAAKKGNK